jgi:hypothetical protein
MELFGVLKEPALMERVERREYPFKRNGALLAVYFFNNLSDGKLATAK